MGSRNKKLINREKDYLWVVLPDAIGIDEGHELQEKIESKIRPQEEKLVLDLSQTTMIYSSGFGLFIRLRKTVTDTNGVIYLVNVSQKIRELIYSLNLDRVFPVYATDVEFELSMDENWQDRLPKEDNAFIFIPYLEDGIYRITFSGQFTTLHDLSPVSEFEPDNQIEHFLINLENVDLIDTYGAQLLNEFIRRIEDYGCKCVIFGADKILRDICDLFSPLSSCTFYDTEKEAINSVKGDG